MMGLSEFHISYYCMNFETVMKLFSEAFLCLHETGVEQLRFTICDFGVFEKFEIAESSRDHFLDAGSIFHLYDNAISSSPEVVVPNRLYFVYKTVLTSG